MPAAGFSFASWCANPLGTRETLFSKMQREQYRLSLLFRVNRGLHDLIEKYLLPDEWEVGWEAVCNQGRGS